MYKNLRISAKSCERTKMSITDAETLVKLIDLLNLFIRQFEVVNVNVLDNMTNGATPWDGNRASSHCPIEHYLSLGLGVFLANCHKIFALKMLICLFTESAHRAVSNGYDLLSFHEATELALYQNWVEFDLIGHGLDSTVAQQVRYQLDVEV